MKPSVKKPFGLSLASKLAAQAICDNVAPASIVLYNMFHLQKASSFPKELDTLFFAVSRHDVNALEKKLVIHLLDEFKKPQADVAQLIEQAFAQQWVKKNPPIPQKQPPSRYGAKTQASKPVKKPNMPVAPVVTVRKSKLGG